jgi:hypothetical protein
MKICILATGRCGSTSLFRCIENHLHKEYVILTEPFDRFKEDKKNIRIDESTPDILIKTLVGQTPTPISTLENAVKFYEWIFETFDKVIILDRKNKTEQTESFAYHTTKNIEDRHNTKRIYHLDSIPSDVINKWQIDLEKASTLLTLASEKYNSKIYYYEDIFVDKDMLVINEIFDYLGVKPIEEIVNRWIISDDKKVRIYKKTGKLL